MAFRIPYSKSIALPVLLAALLVGCSGSSGGSGTLEMGVSTSGQALTSADPAPDAGPIDPDAGTAGPRLILNVRRIDVHVAGADDDDPPDAPGPVPPNPPPPDDEGGWVTVFSGAVAFDLFQPGSVETFLASATVPAGKITQIRLVLADAVFIDGTVSKPVTCPSCTQTGLKIVTMGKVVVPVGGTLHVTLDFERDRSLRADKDGYRLDPVVKVARTSVK